MMVTRPTGVRGLVSLGAVTLTPDMVAQYPPNFPLMQYLTRAENEAAGVPFCFLGTPIPTPQDWIMSPDAPEASPDYRVRLDAYRAQCGAGQPRLYYDPATQMQITDPATVPVYPGMRTAYPNILDPQTQAATVSAGQPRPTGTGPAAVAQPAQPGVMTALPGTTPGNAIQTLLAQAVAAAQPVAAATGVSSTVLLLGAAVVAAYFLFGRKGGR